MVCYDAEEEDHAEVVETEKISEIVAETVNEAGQEDVRRGAQEGIVICEALAPAVPVSVYIVGDARRKPGGRPRRLRRDQVVLRLPVPVRIAARL